MERMIDASAEILDAVTGKPVGGRRVARPGTVELCTRCGEALGASYADCRLCHEVIERYWLADWQALLERERVPAGTQDEQVLAQLVLAEYEQHPWTEIDIAMSLLRCETCGSELGERYRDCVECGMAFGASLLAEFGASPNEHTLHIGRWVLRYPQRHSANAVAGWRLTMPRILTGWLPTTQGAQRAAALIKAGRLHEVEQMIRVVDEEIRRNSG
jgi:hypothetical protein